MHMINFKMLSRDLVIVNCMVNGKLKAGVSVGMPFCLNHLNPRALTGKNVRASLKTNQFLYLSNTLRTELSTRLGPTNGRCPQYFSGEDIL